MLLVSVPSENLYAQTFPPSIPRGHYQSFASTSTPISLYSLSTQRSFYLHLKWVIFSYFLKKCFIFHVRSYRVKDLDVVADELLGDEPVESKISAGQRQQRRLSRILEDVEIEFSCLLAGWLACVSVIALLGSLSI